MSEPANLSDRQRRDRDLFDQISIDYTRKDVLVPHRRARRLRLMQTLATAAPTADTPILEVGCGAGYAADYLGPASARYVGIDYSEKLIDIARANNSGHGAKFEVTNIDDFKPDNRFQMAFMIGLLHHLDDPVRTLDRLKDLVEPGGLIIANEPQSGNPVVGWMRRVRKKVDEQYSDEQVDYSRQQLQAMYANAGLEDIEITAQGILSTPFAEVVMPMQSLVSPVSALCCAADRLIERVGGRWLYRLSW
ncbi:MAG TPA: class I SAM-dependent methyltransferase, partial [Rhodospirillales bacterium]|nr:class I SAM-dependent methyltransferase [Rhodospirillales bacterium]